MSRRQVSALVGLAAVSLTVLATNTFVSAANQKSKYKIAMAVMADAKWDAIRYDVHTGRAWHIVEGKWTAMKDVGDLPASRYQVHIVPLKNDWGALRIDVNSGRSWAATPQGWVEIAQP